MTKRLLLAGLLAAALSLALTGIASAQGEQPGGSAGASAGEVALLLAPLVAAATAIERAIEMIFDLYESIVLSASRFLGEGKSYLGWARIQVRRYREALVGAQDSEVSKLETQLANAQQRLKDALTTQPYTSVKRLITLVLGIILGLIVAWLTRLQMFKLLGVDFIALSGTGPGSDLAAFLVTMDIIITGLVIGTGSAPVHSLIGLLQTSKEALDEARSLASARKIEAIKDVLLAQQQRYETLAALPSAAASNVEVKRLASQMLE